MMTDLGGQEREQIGGFLLEEGDNLRERVPTDLRQYGDLYALVKGDTVVGVTDEYGTCHWAAEGWTLKSVEDLILNKDGSIREDFSTQAIVR